MINAARRSADRAGPQDWHRGPHNVAMPSPAEIVRAYRRTERRLDFGMATATIPMFAIYFLHQASWLDIDVGLATSGAFLAVVWTLSAFRARLQRRFQEMVLAMHELVTHDLPAPEPLTVRAQWLHPSTAGFVLLLVFVSATAYFDPDRPTGLILGLVVLNLVLLLAVAFWRMTPRRPGILLRLDADGVHVPMWKLTVPWREIEAVWPVPDPHTRTLGVAFHLHDPEVTLARSELWPVGRWRLRKSVASSGDCLFLPQSWLRAPVETVLRPAHAYWHASYAQVA